MLKQTMCFYSFQSSCMITVTLVFVLRKVSPMRSMVRVHIVFNVNTEHLNKNNKTTKTVLNGAAIHRTEKNHPQLKGETRLPKYGSQSGTMIDSCL
jgi:hypothetical protein